MAKVQLLAGVMSLHGKVGNYCYRTYKNGTIILSRIPQKSNKAPTAAQKQQRDRFSSVVQQVNEVMKDPKRREVMEILYKKQGRKCKTLRGFVYREINKLYRDESDV